MALQAVLDKSKDLIRQGETGKAISVLLDALDQDKVRYADTIRTLELVASDFNLTRKKEQRGTLQASELQIAYNKSNEALLGIIDALGTGVPPLPAIAARVHWKRWILLLIPLAMLMWMLVSYLNQKPAYCPQWQDRGFRVMVLPFENLGEISSNPAAALIDSIVLLTQRNDLPVEVHTSKRPDAQAGNHANAADLGASCNAELVVWGKYMAFSNDSIRIRFGYVFVREGEEHLGAFNSFADVTEVGPDRDLHDVLFSICSMLAMNNQRGDLAKKWLHKIRQPNATEENVKRQLEGEKRN